RIARNASEDGNLGSAATLVKIMRRSQPLQSAGTSGTDARMASYRGHLATSSVLGAVYGGAAAWYTNVDWGPACLGAGLTAVGGLLPDLDSDSGVPVRELFGLLAATVPFLLVGQLTAHHLSPEQILVVLGGAYIFIRYGLAAYFKRLTVHRGMFHSIPG